jgi:hypothetical protein
VFSVVLYAHWMSAWMDLQRAWMGRPACLADRYASERCRLNQTTQLVQGPIAVAGVRCGRPYRSVHLLDLVDAGERAAENAWAARACDGSEGAGRVDAEQSLRRGILGRPLTAEAVGWCVWGLSLPLAVAGAVLWVLNRDLGGAAFVSQLLLVPGFASVGVVVAVRRPDHRIGWLFLGMGLVAALTGFGFQYAVRAGVTAPGSLPAGWLLAAVAGWT